MNIFEKLHIHQYQENICEIPNTKEIVVWNTIGRCGAQLDIVNPIPARIKKSFRHNLHNSSTIEISIFWEGHIDIGYSLDQI